MMRRVVFLGLFLVVVLSGCQNGDQQDIEFLEELGEDVVSLFNSKKNDLHMDLSMDRLNEVGEKVSEGQARKLSKKNQKRMDVLEEDYTDALEMFVLEEEIEALFEEDQVLATTFDLGDIENAEKAYEDFDLKKYSEYDARVGEQLIEAREQADQIMLVEDLFLEVFDEDGMIREDTEVDREKLATEIKKIKNPVFREDYEKWLAKLDEETVDEEPEEEDEVDEEEETASEADDDDVGNFGSTNNSNNGGNNNHSNSGNSGNNSSWSGGSSSGSGQGSGGSAGGSSGGTEKPKPKPEEEKPKPKPEEESEKEDSKPPKEDQEEIPDKPEEPVKPEESEKPSSGEGNNSNSGNQSDNDEE